MNKVYKIEFEVYASKYWAWFWRKESFAVYELTSIRMAKRVLYAMGILGEME